MQYYLFCDVSSTTKIRGFHDLCTRTHLGSIQMLKVSLCAIHCDTFYQGYDLDFLALNTTHSFKKQKLPSFGVGGFGHFRVIFVANFWIPKWPMFIFRCCWAVANHDFVEAYVCQSLVVQYPLQKIRAKCWVRLQLTLCLSHVLLCLLFSFFSCKQCLYNNFFYHKNKSVIL